MRTERCGALSDALNNGQLFQSTGSADIISIARPGERADWTLQCSIMAQL